MAVRKQVRGKVTMLVNVGGKSESGAGDLTAQCFPPLSGRGH